MPGDYGALQNALNEWLGESAQLKYPIQGELLSPFLLQDLDGDGQQDAAVLYTTAQSSNVCIAFCSGTTPEAGRCARAWRALPIRWTMSVLHSCRMDSCQLVVGYLAAQGDSYLAVYSYENGTVNAILEQSYEQYLVEDITGGGNEDLILMSTLEDGGVQIELLTVDRDGMFQQVAVMGLSADKFSGCAAVAAGLGADGKHYLVLDGWTGLSGNNLATVLLYFDEESQQMLPAEQISTSELYNASLRNVSSLVSQDLDGDGIVEIPTQPDEAGLLNMSQSRRMDFIVWMDYTASAPEKSFGLLDEESGCYIALPVEWEGNLMLTDSTKGRGGRGAADRGREQAGAYPASGSFQRERGGLDPLGRGGIPPDAGQVRAGRGAEGSELSTVPVVVPVEWMMPLSFAEVYRMQAECSEMMSFFMCSWAEGEDGKVWRFPMVKVLVVEDEASIREMIALNLRLAGMEAVEADSAEAALPLLEQRPGCDAAILDVMLPGMNGFSLCETIRRTDQKIGIIILSAKGQEQDKIRGLSIGADDYMTKPFSVSELLARVEALCRRVGRSAAAPLQDENAPTTLVSGELCAGREPPRPAEGGQAHRADSGGVPDHGAVLPQPGVALVREILKGVWGENYFGDVKIVDVNIRRLRMKVEDEPSHPTHILTVWGYGYRWEE